MDGDIITRESIKKLAQKHMLKWTRETKKRFVTHKLENANYKIENAMKSIDELNPQLLPFLEMVLKAELYHIFENLLQLSKTASKCIFNFDLKKDLEKLNLEATNLEGLFDMSMNNIRKLNKLVSEDERGIAFILENSFDTSDSNWTTEIIDFALFLREHYFQRFAAGVFFQHAFDFKQYGYSAKELIESLIKCSYNSGRINDIEKTLLTLKDYVRMSVEMGIDFKKSPKNLIKEHNAISNLYKANLQKIEQKKFDEKTKKTLFMEKEIDKYSFIIPKTPSEIVYEGDKLKHCVESYIESHTNGMTTVIFMRKIKDIETPLVTIEVDNHKRFVQASGYHNRELYKEEITVLNDWLEKIGAEGRYESC